MADGRKRGCDYVVVGLREYLGRDRVKQVSLLFFCPPMVMLYPLVRLNWVDFLHCLLVEINIRN